MPVLQVRQLSHRQETPLLRDTHAEGWIEPRQSKYQARVLQYLIHKDDDWELGKQQQASTIHHALHT
jgi:hypothetical protein